MRGPTQGQDPEPKQLRGLVRGPVPGPVPDPGGMPLLRLGVPTLKPKTRGVSIGSRSLRELPPWLLRGLPPWPLVPLLRWEEPLLQRLPPSLGKLGLRGRVPQVPGRV